MRWAPGAPPCESFSTSDENATPLPKLRALLSAGDDHPCLARSVRLVLVNTSDPIGLEAGSG